MKNPVLPSPLPEKLGDLLLGEVDRAPKEAMINLECVKPGPDGKPCGFKFKRRLNRLMSTRLMCEKCVVVERAKPRCRKCGALDHATSHCPDSKPSHCTLCLDQPHRVEGENCSKCGLVYEAEEISVFEKPTKPPRYVPPTVIDTILISRIKRERATQSRVGMVEEVVEDYVEKLKSGVKFPPIVVFYDGTSYWLADGFHRVECNLRAGYNAIECDIRSGSQRDAILHAVGANANHGRQRTNDDKRRAVTMLLEDRAWFVNSDRWIAQQCIVSPPFVAKIRREIAEKNLASADEQVKTFSDGDTSLHRRRGLNQKVYEFPKRPVEFSTKRALARVESLVESLLESWPAGASTAPLAKELRALAKKADQRTVVRKVERA